ncbi:methionine adenosyltransferase [Mollicutes bacterium LVI A0039]|nr:methionine adenosyltransferase [Mollicutes bacterium LVI A0039]
MSYLFTSESVTEGHPDKVCDQISDNVLDAILSQDPDARVACETFATTDFILVGGEVKTSAKVDYEQIARDTLKKIGYDHQDIGIDYKNCEVKVLVHEQSQEINEGVDKEDGQIGAGDQGLMFGYATNESDNLLPYAINFAHNLAYRLTKVRKDGTLSYLRPDGKTQVTVEYNNDGTLNRIHTILISTQHDEGVSNSQIEDDLINHVIGHVIPAEYIDKDTKLVINPSGSFIVGGPHGDAGLTGRKIIVDTYGGSAPHGGGAFSGKDYTKVDRSAAYIARKVAKNIVASGICNRAQVQLAYGIGLVDPISVNVDTFGTAAPGITEAQILEVINNEFDLSPAGIIKELDMKKPIYSKTATYGHFGKAKSPWEATDKADAFRALLK